MKAKPKSNALDRFLDRAVEWRAERKPLARLSVARVRRSMLAELWQELQELSLEQFGELFRGTAYSSAIDLLGERRILTRRTADAYELAFYNKQGIREALPMLVFQILIGDYFWLGPGAAVGGKESAPEVNPVAEFIASQVRWTIESGRPEPRHLAVVSASSLDSLWQRLQEHSMRSVSLLFRSLVGTVDSPQSQLGKIVIEEHEGRFHFSRESEKLLRDSLSVGLFQALCARNVWSRHSDKLGG